MPTSSAPPNSVPSTNLSPSGTPYATNVNSPDSVDQPQPIGSTVTTANPNGLFTPPQTIAPTPTYTPPTAITSDTLTPQTPFPLTQPASTPIPNTANLNGGNVVTPPLTETPEQSQESSLSQQLESLTNEDAGKAAYTNSENESQGVNALTQTQTDLGSQLKTLQDQAQAIPLEDENAGVGRMSTTGISGQDTVNLRTNAVQTLALSAQIDATNGLLASAQNKVTLAVNTMYGPIESQMAALSANLKTIQDDPQSTVDEQNEASEQADNVAAQTNAIAMAKANTTAVYNTATAAAANISNFTATGQYTTPAQAINAIMNAPDPATALQIATATGLTQAASTTAPKIIGSSTEGYYEVDPKTGALTSILPGKGTTLTATELEQQAGGNALNDAEAAIKAGADPTAVKQAFLTKYPTMGADWNSYFTNTSQTGTTGAGEGNSYPAATPVAAPASSFNIFNPSTWGT